MKLKPMNVAALITAVVIVCVSIFYLIYRNRAAEVNDQQVSVNTGTGYSADKNAVHDLLIINEKEKYGFASKEGNVVVPPKYDIISIADYGLYYVKEGKSQGFVNEYMQPIFMTEETINTNISEDFVIYTRDKKSGFINIKTGEIIDAVYDAAYDFSEGYAAVLKNDKIGFINQGGEIVIQPQYYNKGLYYFKSGLCNVRLSDPSEAESKSYYIDQQGNTVIDDGFQYGMPFYENMAFVMKNQEWFMIDMGGNYKSEIQFGPYEKTIPGRFKDGHATVIENGKYGVIDSDGEYIIKPEYDELADLADDKIVFKKDGKYGYMTVKGKVIIEPKYSTLSSFKNGVAVFMIDNKYGLVSDDGKEMIPAEYEKMSILDNGRVQVFFEGKQFYYTDIQGNIIWQPKDKK